jgi:hypothetical protein
VGDEDSASGRMDVSVIEATSGVRRECDVAEKLQRQGQATAS